MISVRDSQYKDQSSVVVENQMIRAEFIAQGGRMVSLRDKRVDHEFLYQQEEPKYVRSELDKPMAPNQAAGYDDMFPTIGACYYQDFPWKGTYLPDHGEVKSLDWDIAKLENALAMSIHGVRLPYRLTRRVTMPAENQLRFDFKLENLSPFSLSYLWSSHPIFRVEEGARIALPEEVRMGTTQVSLSGRIGKYGHRFSWPISTDEKGKQHDLSLIRPRSAQDITGYHITDPLVHGWCAMNYPSVKRTLKLSFPPEFSPYLQIGILESAIGDGRYLALLEPCTAPFGRLDNAAAYQANRQLPARGSAEWFLSFSIENA